MPAEKQTPLQRSSHVEAPSQGQTCVHEGVSAGSDQTLMPQTRRLPLESCILEGLKQGLHAAVIPSLG